MTYPHKRKINTLALFILIIACSVLTGWYLDITLLISLSPRMTAMNPLTAVSFMVISIWLFSWNYNGRKGTKPLQLALSIFVLLVGILKLSEYGGFIHLRIDDILFRHKLETKLLHNAIAPTTALLFALCGTLLLNILGKRTINKVINDSLIIAGFLLAYIGIIGYIYSLEPFYRIGPFVPMALNTATCFLLVVTAIFLAGRDGGIYGIIFSPFIGGVLARRAIPLLLLIPPAFGYSRLLLHRAGVYNVEYSVALDTAFLVLVVLLLICFYAGKLNKKDEERKLSVDQIKESEEKFRSLVYAMQEGVLYYNTKGTILFYNPSFASMLGYNNEELTGRNIIEVTTSNENLESAKKRFSQRLQGKSEDYESQLRRSDGSMILVYITARPMLDKDQQPVAFFSTITDITEDRKREEEIEAFSASAAHDMNAPLAKVAMITDLLLDNDDSNLNEDEIAYLKLIEKTNTDMRATLQDLLHFSRVGHEKIVKEPVDMDSMAREIMDTQHYLNPTATITIGDLPTANGSPAALKHVWMNLISNALKYSSKKPDAAISITGTIQDGRSLYMIQDNGAGFSMEQAGKLFVPFKRLHANFEGNGLGLPIVKRIVEKHGGRIWAEGEPGKGATFYFTI